MLNCSKGVLRSYYLSRFIESDRGRKVSGCMLFIFLIVLHKKYLSFYELYLELLKALRSMFCTIIHLEIKSQEGILVMILSVRYLDIVLNLE